MNSALFSYYVFCRQFFWISVITLGLLSYSTQTKAQNWQLMLMPEAISGESNQQKNMRIPDNYSPLEKGLTLSLSRSLETLIDKQRVFPACKLYLCGQQDISSLMQKIRSQAPEVHLVIMYSISEGLNPTLSVRLLDPLSYRVRFSDSLGAINKLSEANLFSLGEDMGKIIEARLDGLQAQTQFSLSFDGFLFKELNGLTTWILANSGNTQLVLTQSSVDYQLLDQYFAINDSHYSLLTTLNASQIRQLLAEFFERRAINININFALMENQIMQFSIVRSGNPYAPSLITVAICAVALALLLTMYVRRQYLDFYLMEYGNKRDADKWLDTYKKASFILYGLQKKWVSRASYWTRLQKESIELASQAKLYFDAGDVHTAKLFVSKSLHSNTANPQANKLIQSIEALELNAKSLSDSEMWIRNKLAKAMNDYRQKLPIKALRRLYQAVEVSQKESSLKKQTKAIKKLIKQINQEFCISEQALVVNCSSDPQSLVICQNETVHLGRRPNNDDVAWISAQDSVFYINHKSVSRAGQQCFINRQKDGFFLVDSNSKNGTFINNNQLIPHQPTKMNKADTIHLGGNTPFISSALKVNLSPNESLLELSIDLQTMTLLDKQELNKVWPDNALAVRSRLVCMHRECCVVFNKDTLKIHIFEVGEVPFAIQKANKNDSNDIENDRSQLLTLCIIKLGDKATIRPLSSSVVEKEIMLDTIPLLGEVPLIFPCTLQYSNISIQLAAYDSTSIRYTHGPFITVPSITGSQ